MEKNGKKVSVPVRLNPEIKQIYLTGAVGTFTNHDFRMIPLNEKTVESNEEGINLVREGDYELIMSHSVVKIIHEWLGNAIEQFESQVGEIKIIGSEKTKED